MVLNDFTENTTVFAFMQAQIERLKLQGKIRTSETYQSTLNSFKRFRNNKDMELVNLDAFTIESFENYLRSLGLVRNTTSFYLRILRTVYNLAVEQELIMQTSPFRHVYTGIDKTIKRAISIKEIKKIKNLDLSHDPALDLAKDLFLFSFYTRGMSFIDMAYLRKRDLRHNVLSYFRKKTGQRLCIRWEKEMESIISKYSYITNATPYLLPIIYETNGQERMQYKNSIKKVNRNLKKISALIGLPVPITMYVARHSWASIAQEKSIPLSIISEGMGHDSEATTQIYLSSLDATLVDKANHKILKGL